MAKSSEIYRKAAQMIADGECSRSCWAIAKAQSRPHWIRTKARRAYVATILGTEMTSELPGITNPVRILALCFMAAIAESEGD